MTTTEVSAATPSAAITDGVSRDQGTSARGRIYFADHMRVALTALVVIHHLTISLAIPLPGSWYYEVPDHSGAGVIFGLVLVLIDQAFFMGAFFLIAGYFTPFSFDRKGGGSFLRDRVVRLLIPLVVFYFVLGPLAAVPTLLIRHAPLSLGTYLKVIDAGPLWFVEVLFLLCCAYALFRLLVRRPAPGPASEPARPPSALAVLLFTIGLALVTFLFRQVVPIGFTIPILGLPTPAYLPQYISLFVVGVIAARRGWFRSIPDWMGWAGFAVSAAVTVVLFAPALLTGLAHDTWTGALHWQAAAYSLWDSTMAVGMFLGLLVVFRRWLNRAGRLWNELSRNAFGVYVIHPPLLVLVALLLTPVPIYPLLRLLVAIIIAIPLCHTAAGLVRRIPGVARVL